MAPTYDVIIIGAGHNGLVAAAYLARAGQRVLVLEQRAVLGGAAATEAVFPGFQVNTGAHDAQLLRGEVIADLELRRHGLEFVESPVTVFAPQPDGRALTLWRDTARSQAEIARFSPADAEKYPAFRGLMQRLIDTLDPVMLLTPPRLAGERPGALLPWARVALKARGLGRVDMRQLLRVLPMAAADLLDEWFASDALKGALGVGAVLGGMFGPLAQGTAFTLLYQRLGPAGGHRFVCGGMGQLAAALGAAARQCGAEIRTGAEVARITLADAPAGSPASFAAVGVALASGEVFGARAVVSSAGPRRTLFDLAGPPSLDPGVMRQVRNIRFRGCTAKVNLALSELPRFGGQPADPERLGGHILISPSLEYLERGADDAKYGQISEQPLLDITIPTVLDAALAPAGQHLLSATMQWAPYHLRDDDWETRREALADRVVQVLEQYAPGFGRLVTHRQVITPLDWERSYGLTEGHIFQGEMGLDQLLFMRPIPGNGQYRMPIAGLYLCGAGAHPGGGVTGAPGHNAAREVLADFRRGPTR